MRGAYSRRSFQRCGMPASPWMMPMKASGNGGGGVGVTAPVDERDQDILK